MPISFKDTLNLPKTDFPMRGNLAQREPDQFKAWDDSALYEQTLRNRPDENTFILHDGPPYANGNIHMGHALNKILKDLVLRYKNLKGFKTPYIPGWDCHGLPIEQQILKEIGSKIHDMDPLKLRELCHKYALKWIDKQRTQFKRLGIMGDWNNPYMTVSKQYEVGILKVLQALAKKNLIKKGYKAVHWDPVFRTALAEAEIEYNEHESPSIYVAMKAKDLKGFDPLASLENVHFVIWTTTPWTMPANLGISLHPEFDYVALKSGDKHFIVAKDLTESFTAACKLEDTEIVVSFKASGLDRATAEHPIYDGKDSLIMLGEHVTLEQGTGCVHTAPGHGADDFIIGKTYGLPVFCPVDNKGCYTPEYPEMEGTFVFDANPKIVEKLNEKGLLVGYKKIKHEYPFSWRSKKPIIFRATEQWFMELAEGGVREDALQLIDNNIEWIPAWGKDRIRGMVERRPEWCISRQRHWGVPIPAVRKLSTNEAIINAEIIGKFIELVRTKGTDAWYSESIDKFLPEGWDVSDYEKEFDILDVWFDSGASHVAVLEEDERVNPPADLYLEGSDQHRGWFQSALLTSVGSRERAPFKSVLTHGFVLDGEGKAMSKSTGNVISPLDLIKQFGSDILRLWVASTDYRNDVGISPEIMKITADAYRTIRNTFRFQIGNLYDFEPAEHELDPADLDPLDQWALHQLAILVEEATEACEKYEFHRLYQILNRYYTVTLSARYHDFLKDRLYTFAADSHGRRSAQTVIHHHLKVLTRILAPILVFTAEEAYACYEAKLPNSKDSIHLENWPVVLEDWKNDKLASEVEILLEIRDKVNEKLEELRADKTIGKSIEAKISIFSSEKLEAHSILRQYAPALPELFIVSNVVLQDQSNLETLEISAEKAGGERCPRCWRSVSNLVSVDQETKCCERCQEAVTH